MSDIETRLKQFRALELPGQMPMMHCCAMCGRARQPKGRASEF